jgi:hypothetical protein
MTVIDPHRRPVQPHRPHPAHGQPLRQASQAPSSGRSGLLQSLSHLAGQSGGTPPAQQPQQPQAAGWESDPVLQQIQALQQANVASAEASAQAARSQTLINFGYDPEMASLYGDQQTAGSAKANPYSVLSELSHAHDLRQQGLNENANKANLFYSGARATALGEEGRNYLGQQAGARASLASSLGGLDSGLLQARQSAQGAVTQGQTDAYTRWLNQQLQYGLGNPAGAPAAAPKAAQPVKHIAKPRLRSAIPAHLPLRRP